MQVANSLLVAPFLNSITQPNSTQAIPIFVLINARRVTTDFKLTYLNLKIKFQNASKFKTFWNF